MKTIYIPKKDEDEISIIDIHFSNPIFVKKDNKLIGMMAYDENAQLWQIRSANIYIGVAGRYLKDVIKNNPEYTFCVDY